LVAMKNMGFEISKQSLADVRQIQTLKEKLGLPEERDRARENYDAYKRLIEAHVVQDNMSRVRVDIVDSLMRKLCKHLTRNYKAEEVAEIAAVLNDRLHQVVAALKEMLPNSGLFLTGSYIEGYPGPNSDIDILLMHSEYAEVSARVKAKAEIEQQLQQRFPWFDPNAKSGLVDVFPIDSQTVANMVVKTPYHKDYNPQDVIF